jgi:hypothetical protein
MSGFSKLYCVGGLGGFMGTDGINPILFQILVGDSDRQWLQVHYFERSIRPLGRIRIIVPDGANNENGLIDTCMAFYPEYFAKCLSMPQVRKKTRNLT